MDLSLIISSEFWISPIIKGQIKLIYSLSEGFQEISRSQIDFKISVRSHSDFKFQDVKISQRFQDLTEISQDLTQISNFKISRFHGDFNRFQDLIEILQDLTQISLKISLIYGNNLKKYLLGILDLGFQQDFSQISVSVSKISPLLQTPCMCTSVPSPISPHQL